MKGRCKDCYWWSSDEPDDKGRERDCRRYPPQNYETDDYNINAYFPSTLDDMWCGEFKEKGEETGDSILLLQLSARVQNCLDWKGIKTIDQLRNASDVQLLNIRNLGRTSLNEVRRKIAEYGQESRKLMEAKE